MGRTDGGFSSLFSKNFIKKFQTVASLSPKLGKRARAW
jgi:hypothetical protein